MSESDAQERTEEATPKRRKEAKEKGQVPRSKDFNTAVILLTGGAAFFFAGKPIARALQDILTTSFTISREMIQNDNSPIMMVDQLFSTALMSLLPFFFILVLAAAIAPLLLGGWSFSMKSLQPKLERISFLKGLKRIFALRGLVELLKSLGKFSVILMVALVVLWHYLEQFLSLSQLDFNNAVTSALNSLIWSFIFISSGLIIIAMIDVPFQLYEHSKKIKMTKQEVKDEYKDTEGKPEVKSHIRRMQQEIARQRMMEEVPKADVVLTNPTHYTVAIKYDRQGSGAPIIVAKGKDQMALRIREVAKKHQVMMISLPPLTRALYFSTDINHQIPHGLYIAVAHVLAYVYQLKTKGKTTDSKTPKHLQDLPIPEELQR